MDRVKMAPFGFIYYFFLDFLFFFCLTPPGQVGGLPTSARVIELTNFKNAPLFITSVGGKFNSLGNSFRHSYLPCATTCVLPALCNFHFRSLPALCFYYLCTTCIHFVTATWNFHFHSLPALCFCYLSTSLLLHTSSSLIAPPQLLLLNCSSSIAPPQLLLLNCSTSIAPPQPTHLSTLKEPI